MNVRKFKKKPVVIEAIQFKGDINKFVVAEFMKDRTPFDLKFVYLDGAVEFLEIKTIEGIMVANIGDYIIKGVEGEFYPCKPDIFYKTYEEVEA